MMFTAFLLGAQHKRDSVENNSARLLVVSLGQALNGMPPSLCGKQVVVGPSSLLVVVAQLTKDMQTEHELMRMNECAGENV